jgi:hypothetical protein
MAWDAMAGGIPVYKGNQVDCYFCIYACIYIHVLNGVEATAWDAKAE